jgi:hypothetical protein
VFCESGVLQEALNKFRDTDIEFKSKQFLSQELTSQSISIPSKEYSLSRATQF